MKISYLKLYGYVSDLEVGEKLPRKIKKQILGFKLSKNKIRKRMNKLEAKTATWANGYKVNYVEDEFCPKCGCEEYYSSGEMAEYPETWVRHYCLRCGALVAEADNSAMVHELVWIKNKEEL